MPHTLREDLDTLHRSIYGEPLPQPLTHWDHWAQAVAWLMTQRDPAADDAGGAPAWFRDQRVPCASPDCPNLTTDTYCTKTCAAMLESKEQVSP